MGLIGHTSSGFTSASALNSSRMKAIAPVFSALLFVSSLAAQSNSPATGSPANNSDTPAAQSSVPPDSTRLVLTHMVQPVYPLEAMRQKLQGQVVIHLVVSTTGDVLSAEPVSGNPIFTQAAVAAMKQWKFQPYIKNGHPVQIGYKMPYDFAIADRVTDNPGVNPNSANGTIASPATTELSKSTTTRVSGEDAQKLLLHRVAPVYPDTARQRMIQGTVVLKAVIGKDGRVNDLKAVSGPKELYDSAIGAVQQWRYKPYTLDGQPVEVETTINVNYKLTN